MSLQLFENDIFKLAIEASPSGQLLVDTSGIIVAINANLVDIFEYNAEELIGKNIECLLPEAIRDNHKNLRSQYQKSPSTRRMGMGRELFGVSKSGKKVPVEIGLNAIHYEGQDFVLTSVVDISSRERALKFSQAILEASPNGLLMINSNGQIVLVNPHLEKVFGYHEGELVGRHLEVLLPERYRKLHPSLRQQFFSEPSSRPMGAGRDLTGLKKDGQEIPIEIGLNPLMIDGEAHVLAAIVDISERKHAEAENLLLQQQVQQSQRLESLGILVGGIAHDFNNILVAILGHAELGLLQLPENSVIAAHLKNVRTASLKASDLIRQMMSYAGKGRIIIQEVNINEVIKEISQLLEVAISKKTIIRTEFSQPLPAIEGDAGQIQQIIMNLITNAAEAIGEKSGMISIRTSLVELGKEELNEFVISDQVEAGYFVMIDVSDTGIGMSADVIEKLFDPFFTTKVSGRGLGLSTVIGIVRSHKGAIKVYSEVGRGSKFSVILPAVNVHVMEKEQMQTGAKHYYLNPNKKKILIIDDEEHVRNVLKIMLSHCDFDSFQAQDGKEGLMLLQANLDDLALVFLDMNMPYMNGSDVFREIRKINQTLPIVIMSGYNEHEAALPLAGKSFHDFVQKPFEFSRIVEVLESLTVSEKTD